MGKYDIKEDLKEKNTRIIKVIDLLIGLDKRDINVYLKQRILYLLNPEVNEYIEYIPFKKRNKKENKYENK